MYLIGSAAPRTGEIISYLQGFKTRSGLSGASFGQLVDYIQKIMLSEKQGSSIIANPHRPITTSNINAPSNSEKRIVDSSAFHTYTMDNKPPVPATQSQFLSAQGFDDPLDFPSGKQREHEVSKQKMEITNTRKANYTQLMRNPFKYRKNNPFLIL